MGQNSSKLICRTNQELKKTFGWNYCCSRGCHQFLNVKVHILFLTNKFNVRSFCSINNWKVDFFLCYLFKSGSLSPLFRLRWISDDILKSNLYRNKEHSQGFTNNLFLTTVSTKDALLPCKGEGRKKKNLIAYSTNQKVKNE